MSTRIIEINGAKLEIDMRHAKRVDTFKVGSRVKVLVKRSYNSTPTIYTGVIVGFDDFQAAPTINVAYLETGYNPEVKFVAINTLPKDDEIYEIIADNDDAMPVMKGDILAHMNRSINTKLEEIRELGRKKRIFLSRFGHTFGESREVIREQLEQDRADETAAIARALEEAEAV